MENAKLFDFAICYIVVYIMSFLNFLILKLVLKMT